VSEAEAYEPAAAKEIKVTRGGLAPSSLVRIAERFVTSAS
jgi:hypothetical protein